MFFSSVDQIKQIAAKTGTSIFVVPNDIKVTIKNAFILQPEDKSTITIAQVREMLTRFSTKQISDQYIIIRPADLLGDQAANALLKNLEEPGEKVHYVLITDQPSKILPTILSRSAVYILRQNFDLQNISSSDDTKKTLAKQLISAKPSELVEIAKRITNRKDKVRDYTLDILSIAIEMLYKSYFLTGKSIFLTKITKFLAAYESIAKNGNIKLQLVANLC